MKTFSLLLSQILIICIFFLSGCSDDSSPTSSAEISALFTMDKLIARLGEAITFTNASDNATSFEWDFGDGNTSTEINPTYSYSSTGVFTITLTASGEGGSKSNTATITIWDSNLNLTFYGTSHDFEGYDTFTAGPVKLNFYNQSSDSASANLVKHDDGYSHQDMLDTFVNGISLYDKHPDWTTHVRGVFKGIKADSSYTWTGDLGSGLYTFVAVNINPWVVYYVAGLTVTD